MREKVFAWIEQKKLIRKDDMVFVRGIGRRGLRLPAAAFAGIQKTCDVLRAGSARGARNPGEGSLEDAKFTRKLCERLGVVLPYL